MARLARRRRHLIPLEKSLIPLEKSLIPLKKSRSREQRQ
jgi:hypothetical protein